MLRLSDQINDSDSDSCTACKWVTTTYSNICKFELAHDGEIDTYTGISMSKLL